MEKKRFVNPIDIIAVILIVLFLVFLVFEKMGKHPMAMAEGQPRKVEIDIIVKAFPCTDTSFVKPGEKLFITVKNQPFDWVILKDVKFYPRQAVVPTGNGGYKLIPNPSEPDTFDIIFTVQAQGYVREDGIIVGTKLKVGIPISLEGKMMDVKGQVAGVRVL
ncbi:DUF4330 domain-containing protein [bacterium]|nr:DUF4330 domain-containing protein [bacterium]